MCRLGSMTPDASFESGNCPHSKKASSVVADVHAAGPRSGSATGHLAEKYRKRHPADSADQVRVLAVEAADLVDDAWVLLFRVHSDLAHLVWRQLARLLGRERGYGSSAGARVAHDTSQETTAQAR